MAKKVHMISNKPFRCPQREARRRERTQGRLSSLELARTLEQLVNHPKLPGSTLGPLKHRQPPAMDTRPSSRLPTVCLLSQPMVIRTLLRKFRPPRLNTVSLNIQPRVTSPLKQATKRKALPACFNKEFRV